MRQHEHDVRLLGPALQGLSERQVAIFLLLTSVTKRYRSTAIPPLRDADLIDAAAAMASTIETADRGIIYEHHTTSIPAQRLADEYQRALTELGKDRPAALQREIAAALRGLERAGRAMPQGATDTALLDLLERVTRNDPPLQETAPTGEVSVSGEGAASPAPRIVLG